MILTYVCVIFFKYRLTHSSALYKPKQTRSKIDKSLSRDKLFCFHYLTDLSRPLRVECLPLNSSTFCMTSTPVVSVWLSACLSLSLSLSFSLCLCVSLSVCLSLFLSLAIRTKRANCLTSSAAPRRFLLALLAQHFLLSPLSLALFLSLCLSFSLSVSLCVRLSLSL